MILIFLEQCCGLGAKIVVVQFTNETKVVTGRRGYKSPRPEIVAEVILLWARGIDGPSLMHNVS